MTVTAEMVEAAQNAVKHVRYGLLDSEMRAVLTAALSVEQTQPGVRVKKLEWDAFGRAETIIGQYDVACIAQGGVFGLILPGDRDNTFPFSKEGSEGECRSAAQSDYEQRIRSALVDVPAVEQEPVAWTSPGQLREIERGTNGIVTKHGDEFMCIPLYASPVRSAIAPAPAEETWRPIDTAPRDGSAVDLWGVNHLHPAKTGRRATNVTWGPLRDWMGNERNDWQHGHGEDFEPTHWRPLPASPSLAASEGSTDA